MVAYQQFVELSQSGNSEARGQAAHLAALAFLAHVGPADEQAALYAALIGFLDDPSVKVRAALAYGLLHAPSAPRPIILALLHDSTVIARAVAQYCPALLDADLIAFVRHAEAALLMAVALRERLSARVIAALLETGDRDATLVLLRRVDTIIEPALLLDLAQRFGRGDAEIRGALLARPGLPAAARLLLVEAIIAALKTTRLVKGAIQPKRLERLLRDAADNALSRIGERAENLPRADYALHLIEEERVSTRIMLNALVNGHVLFFADLAASLAEMSRDKVFSLLETGSRAALNALFARCGMKEGLRVLMSRLVLYARDADLADDEAARHFVVTALTEEMVFEYDGLIPPELEEAFTYLSEQNVALARQAARGVMSAFAGAARQRMPLPDVEEWLALPAA